MLTKILQDIKEVFVSDYCRYQIVKLYRQHAAVVGPAGSTDINAFSGPHCDALLRTYKAQGASSGASFSHAHMQAELLPFFLMDANIGPKALAEYIIFKKNPKRAEAVWLKEEINRAFSSASTWNQQLQSALTQAVAIKAPWLQLIEDDVISSIYKRLLPGSLIQP
jgi:hypothetical protein